MSATIPVAETSDVVAAAIWSDALREAGIRVGSFERGHGAALGGAVTAGSAMHVLIVGSADIGAARSVIADLGGTEALLPVRDAATQRASQMRALLAVLIVVVGAAALALSFALGGS